MDAETQDGSHASQDSSGNQAAVMHGNDDTAGWTYQSDYNYKHWAMVKENFLSIINIGPPNGRFTIHQNSKWSTKISIFNMNHRFLSLNLYVRPDEELAVRLNLAKKDTSKLYSVLVDLLDSVWPDPSGHIQRWENMHIIRLRPKAGFVCGAKYAEHLPSREPMEEATSLDDNCIATRGRSSYNAQTAYATSRAWFLLVDTGTKFHVLPFHAVATAMNCIQSGCWPWKEKLLPFYFVKTFVDMSQTSYRTLVEFTTTDPGSKQGRQARTEILVWFHLRHFAPKTLIDSSGLQGILFKRIEARIRKDLKYRKFRYLTRGRGDKFDVLQENVAAVSLNLLLQSPKSNKAPLHTIIVLADTDKTFRHMPEEDGDEIKDENMHDFLPNKFLGSYRYDISSVGNYAGIGNFLIMVLSLAEQWERGWADALDIIDKAVNYQMEYTFDDDLTDEFIFDDSFERSKLYFVVLQFLRTATDMVNETQEDWSALIYKWRKKIAPSLRQQLGKDDSKNWDKASVLLAEIFTKTQRRIERKTEEVKSLRDGLFNATSLREATRGMGLNRALYIFTVVTVVYTPLGFMTSFWALPFLTPNSSGDGSNDAVPSKFIMTFILVPILTYFLCIISVWCLSDTKPAKVIRKRVKYAAESLFSLVKEVIQSHSSVWEMLAKMRWGCWVRNAPDFFRKCVPQFLKDAYEKHAVFGKSRSPETSLD